MTGIDDETVCLALAFHSITYSEAPELVVEALDRVLIPGGAVKAMLMRPNVFGIHTILRKMKSFDIYTQLFSEKGYDVATRNVDRKHAILLAIKPDGSKNQATAEDLMKADNAEIKKIWTPEKLKQRREQYDAQRLRLLFGSNPTQTEMLLYEMVKFFNKLF